MGSIAERLEREAALEFTGDIDPSTFEYEGGPGPSEVDAVIEHLVRGGRKPPYAEQRRILHEQRRLILVAGGERAGKSHVSSTFGVTRIPYGKLFWIVADNYELARPEFNYITEMLSDLGAIEGKRAISAPKVGKATARTKTGQLLETKTADDVRKLAAVAPDGIIMAEAAQCSYEVYTRCVGRLAEKRGWLLMSGTFEGSLSWYAEKFNEWQNPNNFEGGVAISLPSWANVYVYPGGRQDPEIQRLEAIYARVPGLFEERLGAVPIPPVGLVFREFRHSIHVNDGLRSDPSLPVYLAIDPSSGGNAYSVLAVQFPKGPYSQMGHPDPLDYCHVVDEIYETGLIDEDIIEIAKSRRWWHQVRGGAIDHNAPDSKKRWRAYGKVALRSEKVPQLEGIRRLKSFMHYERDRAGLLTEPAMLQIHPKVKSLPYEFGRFKRKDAVNEDREPRDTPIDEFNHSIKALWYLLISRYGYVTASKVPGVTQTWQKPQLSRTGNSRSPLANGPRRSSNPKRLILKA